MTDPSFNASASDTVYILVCFFLALWFLKAALRFYRVLRIRDGVLSERVIAIDGLGSFLSYFESATRAHVHAIAHTRQALPPEKMRLLFMPYHLLLSQLALSDDSEEVALNLRLRCPGQCRLLLLQSFSAKRWTAFLSALREKASPRRREGRTQKTSSKGLGRALSAGSVSLEVQQEEEVPRLLVSLLQPSSSSSQAIAGKPFRVSCPALVQAEACDDHITAVDIPGGECSVSLPLRSSSSSSSNRKTLEELRPAILLLPLHPLAPPRLRTALLPPRDPQGGRPSEASSCNSPASDTSTSQEEEVEEGAAVWVLGSSTSSEVSDSLSLDLSADCYLLDRDGATFSMQEVFGLHACSPPSTSATTPSSSSSSTTSSSSTGMNGGHFVREECVCLLFVDKCPVCRAFFQQYAVIQCPSSSTTTSATLPADPIPAIQTV
eukprot:gene7723-8534_t